MQTLWRKFRSFRVAALRKLTNRHSLPPDLNRQFEEFKDIKSIDRIMVAAWIGFALSLCLFGLDYYRRYVTFQFVEGAEKYNYYLYLFYFHLIMVLFVVPAVYITRYKTWIIQTRLRRGIVIWGMVVFCFIALLAHAAVIYMERGTLTMFMGFVFTASWMFSMSHRERLLFFSCTTVIMVSVIYYNGQIKQDIQYVNFIEVFFLSLVAFFFDAFDYNLKITNFLNQLQIEKEQRRIKSLEEFKSRFFTNLTHEFRTPLTLIYGMTREIADDPLRWHKEGTALIQSHTGNLLNLVNQILDISKIESGSMPVHMVQGDFVSFLGYTLDSFKGHAVAKQIQLHFIPSEQSFVMDYDPDKIFAIVSNLLSNAVKFTPAGGHIYVSFSVRQQEEKHVAVLQVKDTGTGIAGDHVDLVFERFYQVENEVSRSGIGTGIGLSLVKELVHVLQGSISVQSAVGKGTQFTILLPIHHYAAMQEPGHKPEVLKQAGNWATPYLAEAVESSPVESDPDGHKPSVLIIEDHPDVVRYLQICLGDLYDLTISRNGEEGLAKAVDLVPDLILSDVLMPVKDGLQVCRELKINPVTSHIPIVLLSAKTDTASRIAGLESGADVYMLKPFEKDELRAQLRNLLERYKEWHRRYADPGHYPSADGSAGQVMEDEFIARVKTVVQEHLDDSEFSVHDLERGVFLSRSQLHKKLKALTGLSATQFINKIRLSAARGKLLANHATISEIAYEVGFTDPNYFTRVYTEMYGESPSETRKTNNISKL